MYTLFKMVFNVIDISIRGIYIKFIYWYQVFSEKEYRRVCPFRMCMFVFAIYINLIQFINHVHNFTQLIINLKRVYLHLNIKEAHNIIIINA